MRADCRCVRGELVWGYARTTVASTHHTCPPLSFLFTLPRYDPVKYYEKNVELKRVMDMIRDGFFSPDQPDRFHPLMDTLLVHGDRFCLLADYEVCPPYAPFSSLPRLQCYLFARAVRCLSPQPAHSRPPLHPPIGGTVVRCDSGPDRQGLHGCGRLDEKVHPERGVWRLLLE
jgi:hypothetical protein